MKKTLLTLSLVAAFLMPAVSDAAPKKKKAPKKKQTWEEAIVTRLKPVPEEAKKRILKALPKKASVKPKQARKVLVFWRCGGFIHTSIPTGNYMLEELGKKTKAFSSDFTDQYADFNEKNLQQYDAIIFNNTTRLELENEAQREAIINFMKAGKGVIGIHAAGDNFYAWKLGAAMIGGQFNGHPWTAGGKWAFKLDDPKHVLNKAFHGKGFWHSDEIYQYKPESYEGEKNLRILVSLDMSKEAVLKILDNPKFEKFNKQYGPGPRSVPVSWLREFEGGRVFYTNLGHREDTYEQRNVVRHMLDGIQYALGDLTADATPTAKAKTGKAALAPAADK